MKSRDRNKKWAIHLNVYSLHNIIKTVALSVCYSLSFWKKNGLGSRCSTEWLTAVAWCVPIHCFRSKFWSKFLAKFGLETDQKTQKTPEQFAPEMCQFAIVWTSTQPYIQNILPTLRKFILLFMFSYDLWRQLLPNCVLCVYIRSKSIHSSSGIPHSLIKLYINCQGFDFWV